MSFSVVVTALCCKFLQQATTASTSITTIKTKRTKITQMNDIIAQEINKSNRVLGFIDCCEQSLKLLLLAHPSQN
jgi:hypothetical protein